MRTILTVIVAILLAAVISWTPASAQQPTGKIVSIKINQNPLCITYDLYGSADKDYLVTLYIQRENDPTSLRRLEKVEGDVGEGSFAGSGRTICWDRSEIAVVLEGVRYQFVLELREIKGGGMPWYLYAGAAVVGAAVYLAVMPEAAEEKPSEKTIPLPPSR